MPNIIQIKRGVTANLPTLAVGELAFTTDNKAVHIGDGTTNYRIDYPAADRNKLAGIEAGAQVTNFARVSDALASATADISVNNRKIVSLAPPTSASDAATKGYVDSVATGLDLKASVRVATTTNITLSGLQTIDGVSLVAGDRVLVKNQTNASQNGIYVASSGAWARAIDADSNEEVTAGMFCFVTEGTTNGDKGFVLITNDPIVLGTTSLTFTQFTGAGGVITFLELTDTPSSYSGAGLHIVRVNSGASGLEFVNFANTYLESTPTNGETNKAPNSNWAFSHNSASSGVHGAGTNTLLHSGSTIDGGTW